MKKITIYHNARCSKSREALTLLQEKNCALEVVEYLKSPLNESQIKTLLKQLQLKPIDMIRTKEECFSELGLSKTSTDAELIKAMVANPILIERPIITDGEKAVIGRPPENALKIFVRN
ncbi:MAG: arsenate reductase (glutaredoxin) [Gammaproteobacteria bacterium]|nr:arsenate reductase (glutaredoxin) [Gammaproteobacteria bacterium]